MTAAERQKVGAIMRELSNAVNSAWHRDERQTLHHMNRAIAEAAELGLKSSAVRS